MTDEPRTALRVGLLLDSIEVPAWIHRAVREVVESPYAEIVLVVVRGDAAPSTKRRAMGRSRWRYLLFDVYERFDRRWFGDGRMDPFEQTTLAPLIEDVARVKVTTVPPDGRALSAAAVAAIRDQNLDVLLRFGFESVRDIPSGIAKHGIWSVDANSTSGESDVLGGFWEVLLGSAINESTLDARTAGSDTTRTIYRSFGSTSPVSVWKTRRERYWKVASFMSRKLRDLSEDGAVGIAPVPRLGEPAAREVEHPAPSNTRLLSLLPRVAAR
ncbi:MAG: hypothetical protein ACXVJO_14510, partial [Thermoanaerobaculia bacterium]